MKQSTHTSLRIGRALLAALALGFAATSAAFASRGTRYFVNDHLATTVGISDAAGEIAAMEADAFGSPLGGGGNAARFTGKPYDDDLGAYVFPFRNYRAEEARWMSADPSGFPDGVNQRVAPTYASNQLDPLGLYTLSSSTTFKPLSEMAASVLGFHQPSTSRSGGTWTVRQSGGCYYAEINNGFKYTLSSVITLPTVGSARGGGTITASSQNDINTHEVWHRTHFVSYADSVLKALENWSGNYASNRFSSSAAAHNAAQTDLQNGINVVAGFFQNYLVDKEVGHGTSYGSVIAGNWVVTNPNWGESANNLIKAYSPTFSKINGNCE